MPGVLWNKNHRKSSIRNINARNPLFYFILFYFYFCSSHLLSSHIVFSLSFQLITQIRGHIPGSSTPFPPRYVPSFLSREDFNLSFLFNSSRRLKHSTTSHSRVWCILQQLPWPFLLEVLKDSTLTAGKEKISTNNKTYAISVLWTENRKSLVLSAIFFRFFVSKNRHLFSFGTVGKKRPKPPDSSVVFRAFLASSRFHLIACKSLTKPTEF